MTTFDVAETTTPSPPKHDAAEVDVAKAAAQADAAALKEVLAPVRTMLRGATLLQVVASVASIVPYLAIAELGKRFISGEATEFSDVGAVVLLLTIGVSVRSVTGGAALAVSHLADAKMQGVLRRRIVSHLGKVPLGWFSTNSSGLVRKATQDDITEVHYLVAHGSVETTAAIMTPIIGIGYLISLDWRLVLLGISTIPIYAIAYATLASGMQAKMLEMNRGIAKISVTIVEFVRGIAVVKAFGQTGQAHAAYRKAASDFGDAYTGWVLPMLRTDALASIALSAPTVLLVNSIGGTWFVSKGWIHPVDAIVATVVAMTLPVAIMTVSFGMQARKQASAAASRIITLLETPTLPAVEPAEEPTSSTIVFDGVSFSYDGVHDVLSDIDLTLEQNTVTAFVGPSGSGKSTLASLIPRFYDPNTGSVSIGGANVAAIRPEALYQRVGFVLQDVQLLGVSMADNIRLGNADATLDDVRAAARLAQIDTRILELPRGYDSVYGNDAHLSGGEAQRVSIARAILANPSIVVLDEATAFADPESEAEIQRALGNLVGGRTLVVIAHRLATIVGADQIVVLDRGRIVERGTHDQLLTAAGTYSRMWNAYIDADVVPNSEPASATPNGGDQ